MDEPQSHFATADKASRSYAGIVRCGSVHAAFAEIIVLGYLIYVRANLALAVGANLGCYGIGDHAFVRPPLIEVILIVDRVDDIKRMT